MKKFTKILSVFMALLMVVSCIPMTAFAAERDTSSLDRYLNPDNLAIVVEDLLTALGDRKEEITPTVLSICFEAIDALRNAAAENNVDVASASTTDLANVLIKYLDKVLAEANLDEDLKDYAGLIDKLTGLTLDLSSVDSIIALLVQAGSVFANPPKAVAALAGNFGDAKNLDVSMFEKTAATKKDPAVPISTKNSTGLDIVYALFNFISAEKNVDIIKKVVKGTFTLGKANDRIKMLKKDLDIDAAIKNMMGDNIPAMVNELLYDNLIATEGAPAYADSIYKDFKSDELLAAALLKFATGEDVDKADATKLANMTLNEIIATYADAAFAKFLLAPLNNDLKKALNDLVAMDPQLDVLKNIINLDYEFKAESFNFAQMTADGLFENLNDLVCNIVEVLLQPAVYAELGLKKGGNENITANLTSVFAYILKTLASNNGGKLEFTIDGTAYSFDFSGFTADKIAGKSLEDMLVAVVGLFYPTLLQVELPAEVKSLEQLAGYTAYVAIDKFMVNSDEVDFNKDYKDLVFANGKVRDISQNQWNNVLGEMGMDVAIYWLNDATNFGMTQADVDALKAKGWTWENFFEEIVDWALGYIKGIPAVADELEIERGVIDGNGAWYKLNVVLNELLPLAFINDCGDETFTFDVYTAVMTNIVPSFYDCDFAAFANVFGTNDNEANPFNKKFIASVIGMVDNLLFSIFEHECGKTASFDKAATATHDGYKGSYCSANGHYVSVTVTPATGATEPSKPSDPSTQPSDPTKPSDPPADDFMLGDVNGDKKVNAADARIVLRVGAQLQTIDESKMKAADVNKDGKVNAADARIILRVSAQLQTI